MELTEKDYQEAAKLLRCEVAVIKAVAEVESAGGGFRADKKPKILFEGHFFNKFTSGKYLKSNPDLACINWEAARKYYSKDQYARLQLAKELDKTAALKSCSWGKFQIMGFNHTLCGFTDVEAFVNAMYINEYEHLKAFIRYCMSRKIDGFLREKNWAKFAEFYNGPGYKKNNYDTKLATAYRKYVGKVV